MHVSACRSLMMLSKAAAVREAISNRPGPCHWDFRLLEWKLSRYRPRDHWFHSPACCKASSYLVGYPRPDHQARLGMPRAVLWSGDLACWFERDSRSKLRAQTQRQGSHISFPSSLSIAPFNLDRTEQFHVLTAGFCA